MGRKVDVDDLVGTAEIRDLLGLTHIETVNAWARRYPDFPRPVIKRPNVSLWLWPEVKDWARRTGRLPKGE